MNSYGSVSRVSESIYKLLRYMNWIDTGDSDNDNKTGSNVKDNDKDNDNPNNDG